jgi:16S rRNA C967 or C1407 C5-methylase (RsmB/RsmF family)
MAKHRGARGRTRRENTSKAAFGHRPEHEHDFHAYYTELFGSERWQRLHEALADSPRYAELSEGLQRPYYLDEASAAIAKLVDVAGARELLDMCAAPGGKSLVLAGAMEAEARLTANERSAARRAKLHRVLEEHLGEDRYERVRVTGHDATKWGLYEQDRYDAVLLDVPCSSERHLVQSPKHLKEWSPKRSERLAKQAVGMLAAALAAVKPGGSVVYATCALSPRENDGVVARILEKRGSWVSVVPFELAFGEATAYGWQVLPDTASGRGPAYCAKLVKGGGE